MKNNLDGAIYFVFIILILAGYGWLTWSSLCFIFGKDVPWYLFLWVFIGFMSIKQGRNSK